MTSGRNGLKQKLSEFLVKDNRIKKIIYISCNIKTLEKDFEYLVNNGNYFITNCCISNEFSGTEYNNSKSSLYIPIGSIVSFSYMELSEDSVPRHPVYRGIRDDFVIKSAIYIWICFTFS